MGHTIAQVLIAALVVGFLLWLLGFAPINETIKKIATGLIVVIALIWVIRVLMGLL